MKIHIEETRIAYLFQLQKRENFKTTPPKVKYYHGQDTFHNKNIYPLDISNINNTKITQYDIRHLKDRQSRLVRCDGCDVRLLPIAYTDKESINRI